jgi:hypothetical protein
MLEKLIQTYLKWTGKGYLVPFINGLANLGRPSTVFFPMELMEQGMAIIYPEQPGLDLAAMGGTPNGSRWRGIHSHGHQPH